MRSFVLLALVAISTVSAKATSKLSQDLESELAKHQAALQSGPADDVSEAAPAEEPKSDDGAEALGPKSIKLQYHAPAQYPVHYPVAYPFVHPAFGAYGAFPYGHPAFGGYGAFPYGHPAFGGYGAFPYGHPAFGGVGPFGVHPAVAAAAAGVHPAFNPYMGGFAEESATITAKGKSKDEPAQEQAQAQNPWAANFAASANQWKQYYAQPISQTQWPGAASRPGVHPTLGGTLNPYSPMGLPNHPYPFPMHQGLKNGPHHPRPFTPLGQYYPGTSGAPFLPGMVPGAGMYPTYFPGSKHGQMTAANAALQTEAAN